MSDSDVRNERKKKEEREGGKHSREMTAFFVMIAESEQVGVS